MTKLTKIVSCILSSAFLAAAGAGCNGYNRPNSGGELPAQDYTVDFNLPATTSAEIKVIIPDNETERKLMNALIEGFNQKYPNIKVTMNFLTIDSYNSTVTKQYSAKVLADVIWTNSSNYYFLVSNGYALNLDHFTEQAEKAGEFDYDADFTEDFRSMGLFGGTRYAVLRSADSVVTFYNKNILTAAGVDLKPETTLVKNGWSWEDFLTVCGQVREYYDKKGDSKFYPIDANFTWEAVSWPVMKSLGGELIDKEGKFALTEEKNEEIYSFVQNMVTKRYIPAENDGKSSFENGTGAMLFQSTTIDHYETTATLKGKFDVVSFPKIAGENSAMGIGFAGYALNSQVAEDQAKLNAASAFMAYLMSNDGQQKAAKDGGLTLPSIRSGLSAENPDAYWHSTYPAFNVAAYTYGSEYKATQDFLAYADSSISSSLINALNSYVGSYCIKQTTSGKAYNLLKGAIQDAFDTIVS